MKITLVAGRILKLKFQLTKNFIKMKNSATDNIRHR